MYLFIPKNINYGLLFIFRIVVPIFIMSFLIFGIGLYEFIVIVCGKKEFFLASKNEEVENKN